MFVKPNPDKKVNGKALKVFDPTRREFLPAEGRDVPRSPYWMRRIQTGDVVRSDAKSAETEKKATPAAKTAAKQTKQKSGSKKSTNKNEGKSSKSKSEPKKPEEQAQPAGTAQPAETEKKDDVANESKGE